MATAQANKKNLAVGALVIVALAFTLRTFFLGGGASPKPVAAAPASSSTTGAATQALNLDPTIRTDLLQRTEEIKYEGKGRNIFKSASEPLAAVDPKKAAELRCKITPDAPGCPLDPCKLNPRKEGCPGAPPPINLKFFGFASKPGEAKKIFLSQGDAVFIASEGDIVNRRYKVMHIGVNSVEIRDVLNDNTQTIPLTQG